MAQFNPKEINRYYNGEGKCTYYTYDEEMYAGTFPEEWVTCHEDFTCPKNCNNCNHFGSWNGVFLGYCVNCSEFIYKGGRGRGFIAIGCENKSDWILQYPSIFETYLNGVNHYDIGDVDFMDSYTSVNQKMPEEKKVPKISIYEEFLTDKTYSIDRSRCAIRPTYYTEEAKQLTASENKFIDDAYDAEHQYDNIPEEFPFPSHSDSW